MKYNFNYVLFFLASIMLTACNKDDALLGGPDLGNSIVGLQITPATASIPIGLHQQYEGTAIFTDGSTEDVTTNLSWSSDGEFAIIDEHGQAQGIDVGEVTIEARGMADGIELIETALLTVTDAVVSGDVVITSDAVDDQIAAGLPVNLIATATLTDGTVFASDNTTQSLGRWAIKSQTGTGAIIDPDTGELTTTGDSVGDVVVQLISTSGPAWPVGETAEIIVTVTDAVVSGDVAIISDAVDDQIAAGLPVNLIATATLTDGTVFASDNTTQSLGRWAIKSQTGTGAIIDPDTGELTTTGDSVGDVVVQLISTSGPAWPVGETAEITITVTDSVVSGDVVITSDAVDDQIAAGLPVNLIATATLTDGTVFVSDNTTQSLGRWAIKSQTGTGAIIDPDTGELTTTGDSVGDVVVQLISTSGPAWPVGETAEITITVTDATLIAGSSYLVAGISQTMLGLSSQVYILAEFSDGKTYSSKNYKDSLFVNWSLSSDGGSGAVISAEGHIDTSQMTAPGILTITGVGIGVLAGEKPETVEVVILDELNKQGI